MTVKEAAACWEMSPQRVRKLLKEGRVPGARLEVIDGRCTWVFDESMDKPEEHKRGRKARNGQQD